MNTHSEIDDVCADLFCGAGGTSTGLLSAARQLGRQIQLIAVNHWDIAISTHSANHPDAEHLCESLDGVDPRKVVPGGRLRVLVASPECTHHSNARGGKPMSDQSRATAWHILRWCEALYVDDVLIENVREFRDWGPLGADGRPMKSGKGKLFRQLLSSLRALGYTVDHRILCAADYGDATTRQRLFIRARRGRKPITWPEPSHLPAGSLDLHGDVQPWRAAREIIDWSIPGKSIYDRKKPLADNTMRRIMAGLRKYSGLEPYIIGLEHFNGEGERIYDADKPMPTITAKGQFGLCEPFLVVLRNNCDARSIGDPIPALCASGQHMGIAQPFILPHQHGASGTENVRSIDDPLPTITGTSSDMFLAEPYLVKFYGGQDSCSVDDPLPTITANYEHYGLAQPFLVNYKGESNACDIEKPCPTITAQANHLYLAEPYLVKYNGTGNAMSVEEPLDTVTSKDRFGLACPELIERGDVAMVDIRFRMLQPHELAAAMSFPEEYQFTGNRDAKVKQIGNAVPVRLATALCRSILE